MASAFWHSRAAGRSCMANAAFLKINERLYELVRPALFRRPAQKSHADIIRLLRWLDSKNRALALLGQIHNAAFSPAPVTVGGVDLPYPLMLAAGFVKGDGFASEGEALAAVGEGQNIIPGWRSIPALVGAVEFGSFTRWPRTGNPGVVMWRDAATQSTQNRVGLRNPGARAAAAFLAHYHEHLPHTFGINVAVTPGLDDITRQTQEIIEALAFFTGKNIRPAWFTLNISCPNTEDDPGGNQTEAQTRVL